MQKTECWHSSSKTHLTCRKDAQHIKCTRHGIFNQCRKVLEDQRLAEKIQRLLDTRQCAEIHPKGEHIANLNVATDSPNPRCL